MGVGFEAGEGNGLAQLLGGFAVQLGKAQVQAAERRIGDEVVRKIADVFVLGSARPILLAEQHAGRSGMVVVGEGPVGAERFFQLIDGEAGVGGEKGARGVDRFQHYLGAAAAANPEAQNSQQFAHGGRFAILDPENLRFAGQLLQFMRLGKIAVDQLQILGLLEGLVVVGCLVAIGHHIARQRRKNIVRVGVAGDGGHAREGTQRSGNRNGRRSFAGGWGGVMDIARQEIEQSQPLGNRRRACGIAGLP